MLTALVVRRRGLRTLKRTENIEDRLNIIHWSQGSFRRRWYDAASDNPRTQLHHHAGYAVWLSTSCTEKFAHDLSGATSNPIWVWSFSLSAHTNARFAIHAKIIEHTTVFPRARNTRTQQLLVTSSQFLEFSISRNFWRLDFTVTLPCCIPSFKFIFKSCLTAADAEIPKHERSSMDIFQYNTFSAFYTPDEEFHIQPIISPVKF